MVLDGSVRLHIWKGPVQSVAMVLNGSVRFVFAKVFVRDFARICFRQELAGYFRETSIYFRDNCTVNTWEKFLFLTEELGDFHEN
jgi:hypothetical protein